MPTRLLPSALVLLPVALGLVACGDEPGTAGPPEVVLDADTTTVSGTEVGVVVPAGGWTFTISDPVEELPEGVAAEDTGGPWVGISWLPSSDAPAFGAVLGARDPLDAEVEVSTDDGTSPVTTLGPSGSASTGGAAWVRVDPQDAVLEVTYDGLAQTVDLEDVGLDPGAAAGFYADDPELAATCEPADAFDAEWEGTVPACEAVGVSVPYVAGLGWVSDPTETWWVVDLRTSPTTPERDGATYRIDGDRTTVRLDDEEARLLEEGLEAGGGWTGRVAILADASDPGTFELERRLTLTRDGGPSTAPEDGEVTTTWTVDLPARAGS